MISYIDHTKAFNVITQDSLLVFQLTNKLVPCAAHIAIGPHQDVETAVLEAYNYIMENFPPDYSKKALIMGETEMEMESVASSLISGGYCRETVLMCGEKDFLTRYPFLVDMKPSEFPIYATQITESLYVGGAGCLQRHSLQHQGHEVVYT